MAGHLDALVPVRVVNSACGRLWTIWVSRLVTVVVSWTSIREISVNLEARSFRVINADLPSVPITRSPSVRLCVAPGGPGVAEVALRFDRSLGMSARSFWGALAAD